MRDDEVAVPCDCIAAQTAARKARALARFEVMGIKTTPSPRLRLPKRAPRQGAANKE